LIGAAIALILLITKPSSWTQVLTERLGFVTPLVLVAFIAFRQFSQERKLLEEYAFKAATAQALRGYTVLLTEQFKDMPEAKTKILKFAIEAMTAIYDRNPLDQKLANYHFIFGSKVARLEAKIDQKFEQIEKKIEEATSEEAEETR
jgi:hypothetical protein